MLDRQWRAQAEEMLSPEPSAQPAAANRPQPTAHRAPPATYNLVTPRSTCPHCNAAIKAHQNIPVLSYVLLGGKCANCKGKISARYPTVELVTAILSAAVAWHFGWHWQTVAALCFTWALVALTVIDLDHQILPDVITLPLLWLGLLLSLAWHPGLTPPIPVDPRSAIIGGAAGYLSLWLVYWAFKLATGKEGMGYGDFKLFGAFGAWMGWQMLPLIILLSAFTGAVVGIALIVLRGRDRNIPIPFGPYLAAAGYLTLWSVYWAFKLLTGKEGMGYGDFKLFGAFGAWMGWQMLPLILLLSAFTGAVIGIVLIVVRGRDRNIPIPFGPYLAAAGWIALMWGPQIVGGYLSMSGLDR
jgi:leader peptidase (prepilin peptidase)/N-methyltransferase